MGTFLDDGSWVSEVPGSTPIPADPEPTSDPHPWLEVVGPHKHKRYRSNESGTCRWQPRRERYDKEPA